MPSWLLTAPGTCLLPPPPTRPAPVPQTSVTSLGYSMDDHALSKWPAFALFCCHQHSRLWGPFGIGRVSRHLEQAEGLVAGCPGGTQRSCSVVHTDHVYINPESESPRTAYDSATFSPFHLPTPPGPASPGETRHQNCLCRASCPPIALKSLLFVRDSRRLAVFCSFSHHSIVILRSLMDK